MTDTYMERILSRAIEQVQNKDRYDSEYRNVVIDDIDDIGKAEVSIRDISRGMGVIHFANLLDNWLNMITKDGFTSGLQIGIVAQRIHRTLQRQIIGLALGIIYGMALQKHSDARNETAIESAQKIRKMVDDGDLNLGAFI